jgi:hypothetical protein
MGGAGGRWEEGGWGGVGFTRHARDDGKEGDGGGTRQHLLPARVADGVVDGRKDERRDRH